VVRHIFQACPVWIYTQSNITSITFQVLIIVIAFFTQKQETHLTQLYYQLYLVYSLLKRRQYLKIFGLQSVEETTILHANLFYSKLF
jgi:hypothetical protein